MAELTTEQYEAMLKKLNDVCQQAQELSKVLKAAMADRARRDQQLLTRGEPERRRAPRKSVG